jgi:hypothetical protein
MSWAESDYEEDEGEGLPSEWALELTGQIPRVAWWVQAVGGARERTWGVLERRLDEMLELFPEVVVVGPRLRSTRGLGWWLELAVEQQAVGPYVAGLAEFPDVGEG